MNREKVIKGLECCTFILGKRKCNECPYQKGLPDNGCYQLQDDFHALLKEKEAEWIEYPKCLAYDGAYSDSHIVCSACKHVFNIMDNCTEEFDYCPHCGAKMEQEGR